jgi:hypothetical protein
VKLGRRDVSVLTEAIERYGLDFGEVPFFGQPAREQDGPTRDVTR